ncbi:MAG TPA: hypothetical protein VMT37_08265 [Solirubrobacterales bacterium]|nr:hypothetical protein [Solirubrobacterales bacterium]
MKNARLVLISSLVLGLLLAASAVGKPDKKPPFKPSTGDYVGTADYPNSGTQPVTGKVTKAKGKYYVQVFFNTVAKCSDDTQVVAGIGIYPTVKTNKTFSLTESGTDSRTGGTNTYKLNGKFTGAKAFTGTASKTTTADPARPESKDCTTGNIGFSLHRKS